MKKTISLILALFLISSSFCFAVSAYVTEEAEPNDSIGEANEIPINTTINAVSLKLNGPHDESDYYKFTIDSDGCVEIALHHAYGAGYNEITLYSYDGTNTSIVGGFNVENNQEFSSFKFGLKAGTYFIKIEAGSEYIKFEFEYDFSVNFTPTSSWEKYPNSNHIEANDISLKTTMYGVTNNQKDIDTYKFTLSDKSYVQVQFSHPYNITTHNLKIYSYDGTSVSNHWNAKMSASAQIDKSEWIRLDAGVYFFEVQGGTAEYNFYLDYSFENPEAPATQMPAEHQTQTHTTRSVERPTIIQPAEGTTTCPAEVHTTRSYTQVPTTSSVEAPTTQTHSRKPSETVIRTTEYKEPETYVEPQIDNGNQVNVYIYINFEYTIINNYVIILNYTGEDSYVTIPEEIDGYVVKGIGDNAFSGTTVEEVEIPNSVTQFGSNAFGEDDGQAIRIYCSDGSAAQNYAEEKGVNYQLHMKDYAGNEDNDYDDSESLSGPSGIIGKSIVIIVVFAVTVIGGIIAVVVIGKKKSMI